MGYDPTDITPGPMSPYPSKLTRIGNRKHGVWNELAKFESREGAKTALFRLRKRPELIPPGKWEFAVQRNDNGSRLMVRCMGTARQPEVAWWRNGQLVTEVPEKEAKAKQAGAAKRWKKPKATKKAAAKKAARK